MLYFTRFMEKQSNNNNAVTNVTSHIFDELISQAWFDGSDAAFSHLLRIVRDGTMPVDYQHSKSGITILMAATIHGKVDVVKAAIASGSNPSFLVIFYVIFYVKECSFSF